MTFQVQFPGIFNNALMRNDEDYHRGPSPVPTETERMRVRRIIKDARKALEAATDECYVTVCLRDGLATVVTEGADYPAGLSRRLIEEGIEEIWQSNSR